MSIRIEKQSAPHLIKTEMNCDGGLAKKLDKFELLKHLNQHSTTLLVGKPRSGKTSLITSLFSSQDCMKKVYHRVYLFQPASSGASVKNNVFDKLPENQIFDELNFENLSQVYSEIKALPKHYNKCIVLDDCAATLKNKELQKLFKTMNNNRRHLATSFFFLTQTYYAIPKELRKVFNNLFIFKMSKMELQTIFEEQIELDKKYVLPISRLVFNEPYSFLFINTDSQSLYRNFDKIVLEEDDDGN